METGPVPSSSSSSPRSQSSFSSCIFYFFFVIKAVHSSAVLGDVGLRRRRECHVTSRHVRQTPQVFTPQPVEWDVYEWDVRGLVIINNDSTIFLGGFSVIKIHLFVSDACFWRLMDWLSFVWNISGTNEIRVVDSDAFSQGTCGDPRPQVKRLWIWINVDTYSCTNYAHGYWRWKKKKNPGKLPQDRYTSHTKRLQSNKWLELTFASKVNRQVELVCCKGGHDYTLSTLL